MYAYCAHHGSQKHVTDLVLLHMHLHVSIGFPTASKTRQESVHFSISHFLKLNQTYLDDQIYQALSFLSFSVCLPL